MERPPVSHFPLKEIVIMTRPGYCQNTWDLLQRWSPLNATRNVLRRTTPTLVFSIIMNAGAAIRLQRRTNKVTCLSAMKNVRVTELCCVVEACISISGRSARIRTASLPINEEKTFGGFSLGSFL